MMFSLFCAPIPADDQDVTPWRNYLSFSWEKISAVESLSKILPMDQRSTDEQTTFKLIDLSQHRFYKQFKLFPVH